MKLHITSFLLFSICMDLLQISLILVKINGSFETSFSASFESFLEWIALGVWALSIILLIVRTFRAETTAKEKEGNIVFVTSCRKPSV